MVMEAMNELGNEFNAEETHEFLKMKFNPKTVVGVGGETEHVIPGTTTQMNSYEFSEVYIGKIKQWAAEYLNIYIPDPGQPTELFNH